MYTLVYYVYAVQPTSAETTTEQTDWTKSFSTVIATSIFRNDPETYDLSGIIHFACVYVLSIYQCELCYYRNTKGYCDCHSLYYSDIDDSNYNPCGDNFIPTKKVKLI